MQIRDASSVAKLPWFAFRRVLNKIHLTTDCTDNTDKKAWASQPSYVARIRWKLLFLSVQSVVPFSTPPRHLAAKEPLQIGQPHDHREPIAACQASIERLRAVLAVGAA